MHIHIIACRVLTRELGYYASQSPHSVDITWMPQGLHDTPHKLREMVSAAMEDIYNQLEMGFLKHKPDVIVLGYGLCSNGVVGLQSGDIPLVIPRTDDCIALFLGSQKRYLELFSAYSGTYWLNNGWVETAFIPSEDMLAEKKQMYAALYGEDNADFLMEQDMLWAHNYRTCGYITSPVYHDSRQTDIAKAVADYNHWQYREFPGDTRLIQKMVDGSWSAEEFLICPPHHRVEAAYDGSKICALPIEDGKRK